MAGCCGRNVKRNKPVDRHGNKKKEHSLKKYAYLNPNQLQILKEYEDNKEDK